jgi:hypothetical protein
MIARNANAQRVQNCLSRLCMYLDQTAGVAGARGWPSRLNNVTVMLGFSVFDGVLLGATVLPKNAGDSGACPADEVD